MRRFAFGLTTSILILSACKASSDGDETTADDEVGTLTDESGDSESSESAESTGDGDGDGDTTEGTDTGESTDSSSDSGTDSTTADTGESTDTGNGECVVTECQGKVYECGDCIDNEDDDDLIDNQDLDCWGPCDNNEAGWKGEIPGQNNAPCTAMDCYFDFNSGAGNDDCYWSHSCDPSDPNPSACMYSEDTNIPGTNGTCAELQMMQSDECATICGPLVPNGCDCFGCCDVSVGNETYTVFLGTETDGEGTCNLGVVDDPELCAPCVQVDGCLNECHPEECEICIGQNELPDDCDEAGCPDDIVSCDPLNNNTDCPLGFSCITGCCYPNPG